MLIKDTEKKLDTECKIVFNKDDRVFTLSRATGYSFQAFLELRGNEKILSVYIPKSNLRNAGNSVRFLTSTTENERFVITSIPIEDSIYELITSLAHVPTTSSFDITVEKGSLTVRFRLHHAAIPDLSRVFKKSEKLKHLVREMNIRPSTGFITLLEHKNSEFPLGILEYSIPFSKVKGKVAKHLFQKNIIAELGAVFSDSIDHKLIFYGERGVKLDVRQAVIGSNVYEVPLEAVGIDTFGVLVTLFASEGLKRFNTFFKKVKNDLRIIVFLQKYDVMRHISDSFTYYSRANIPVDLLLSMDYNQGIWETI